MLLSVLLYGGVLDSTFKACLLLAMLLFFVLIDTIIHT